MTWGSGRMNIYIAREIADVMPFCSTAIAQVKTFIRSVYSFFFCDELLYSVYLLAKILLNLKNANWNRHQITRHVIYVLYVE